MTFFGFNHITDPDVEFVNEQTHLNDNWDDIDTRLAQFQGKTTGNPKDDIVSPPIGSEALDISANEVRVYDGTSWRNSTSIPAAWTGWTQVPLTGTIVHRGGGFNLQWRVNTAVRRVQLAGGVYYTSIQSAWPHSKVQITTNLGGIPSTYNPVNGESIQQGCTGISTTDGLFLGARIHIESNPTPGDSVRIYVSYQGDAGGGNFVHFDQITWWY